MNRPQTLNLYCTAGDLVSETTPRQGVRSLTQGLGPGVSYNLWDWVDLPPKSPTSGDLLPWPSTKGSQPPQVRGQAPSNQRDKINQPRESLTFEQKIDGFLAFGCPDTRASGLWAPMNYLEACKSTPYPHIAPIPAPHDLHKWPTL